MSNCTNCSDSGLSNCGFSLPSTCVVLSKTFSYDCDNTNSCYKTLEDLLRYWKPIICDAKTALDLSSLDRTCYTSATTNNIGLTLVAFLQELIDNDCKATTTINNLTTTLSTYIPDYHLSTTVNFRCTWNDPCVDGQPLTLQTALQRIIDKICTINDRVTQLETNLSALPWSYPIDYNLYPCIIPNPNKSDLDNLFKSVQDICATYGSGGMSTSIGFVGATSLAQAISKIWSAILALQTAGGGGGSTIYLNGNDFDLNPGTNTYSINVSRIQAIINKSFIINNSFSAGPNITIDFLTGVISANPPALTLTTSTNAATLALNDLTVRQKREIFYESALAGISGNDDTIVYHPVVVTTTTALNFTQLPASGAAGANGSVIIVDSYVAGVSKRMLPGVHYTIMFGRVGITLLTGIVAGQIIDVTYF